MHIKERVLCPLPMFFIGGLLGFLSKIFDIYFNKQYYGFSLGQLFSELSIWFLFGILICIYSKNKVSAVVNLFVFCVGMLFTYYVTAELLNAVYSWIYIKAWSLVALFSPLFAMLCWETKGSRWWNKVFSVLILVLVIVCDIVIYGGPRWYGFVLMIVMAYFLFVVRIDRSSIKE